MNKKGQNDISGNYLAGSDLADQEEQIVREVSSLTGFVPVKLLGKSSWWTSKEIGAFHYSGTYKNKSAVLKIQGTKTTYSEIAMIKAFAEASTSKLIRPPHLYSAIPWADEKGYEALILEDIGDQRVVHSCIDEKQVNHFFEIYQDYRINCLQKPWVNKPQIPLSQQLKINFEQWRKASFKLYPNHPYRKSEDKELINEAVIVLQRGYEGIEPEFVHGHFSTRDLYQVGDQIVLLANLYWSWRLPFYDAVFAQHWGLYDLDALDGLTVEMIPRQRYLWLKHIERLPQMQRENKTLLQLALLERTAAGLNLDALSIDIHKPMAETLVETTRNELKALLKAF